MNELVEGLKQTLKNEDARYVYADTVVNSLVSAQIKALRENRKFSQQDLADLIRTKQSGISRLEKAGYSEWKIETLRKLARAFGVRLRISFDEFGTLPPDIGGFTPERLTPRKFEEDPIFGSVSRSGTETAAVVPPLPRDEELHARQTQRPGIEWFQMLPNGNENTAGGASDYRHKSSQRIPPLAEKHAAELSGAA